MAKKVRKIKNKTRNILVITLAIVVVLIIAGVFLLNYFNLLPQQHNTTEKFKIKTVHSSVDFNNNGVDDYTDIMLGARKDAEKHPTYDGSYYDGGYPPENIGVCTDVIWRGFKNAGYSLRDMVNGDIIERPEAYPNIKNRDKNIDFRRVGTLHVFFEKYAQSLSLDTKEIAQWQPGDIIIFGDNDHIGIVSDKRNQDGRTYIIHNAGQPNREEDYLKRAVVTGHYRFDASRIENERLVKWQ